MALSHFGLDEFLQVDVYESAVKFTQVGAGISLWPRTWEVLKDLGMAGDLESRMTPGETPPDSQKPSALDRLFPSINFIILTLYQDWHFLSERVMNKMVFHSLI